MFSVGDRVRIKSGEYFVGEEGTLVLITEDGGEGLDYIVDVDGNEADDPFVYVITALYGVPSSSVPFHVDQLELIQ